MTRGLRLLARGGICASRTAKSRVRARPVLPAVRLARRWLKERGNLLNRKMLLQDLRDTLRAFLTLLERK